MSVEQPDVFDGIGLNKARTEVRLMISDHLSWSDPAHIPHLIRKIESYVAAATSDGLTSVYPAAEGKAVLINLIHKHLPDRDATNALEHIRAQVTAAGIGFEHGPLSPGY